MNADFSVWQLIDQIACYLLHLFSYAIDVVLIGVGVWMAYTSRELRVTGAMGSTIRQFSLGAIILGMAHFINYTEHPLEVLLVRRHGNSGVLGGVHVFPGGKLDAADRLVDPAAPAAHRRLAGSADCDAADGAAAQVLAEAFPGRVEPAMAARG